MRLEIGFGDGERLIDQASQHPDVAFLGCEPFVNGVAKAVAAIADHGLTKLKVAVRGGVVFASFDHEVESLEDYMGPTILCYFDRLFNGRQLTILGYNRQRIPGGRGP